MKRIILPAVTLVLLAGAGSSCISLDETLITGVSSQYYATPDGLNSALIASYAQLRNFYGKEQMVEMTQLGTDTWMTGDQGVSTNAMAGFDSYDSRLNSQANELNNTWSPAYQMINNLNAALDRGPNTAGVPVATRDRLLGEAHFLRALEYFTLVQQFGDLTLSMHENQGVVVSGSRQPASEVYAAIIADLDTAISQLPVAQVDYGRATKGAALTLRSKVYLTRAYKSFGTPAADFAASLADAKAVIAMVPTTYALEPNFADLWCVARAADPGRGGYCDITSYNQNRKEFIFTVQFSYLQPDNDVGGFAQYNYLHLVFPSQYDAAATGVGIGRDINNGRPFRRLKPTQYGLAVFKDRYIGTPGASSTLDTRFDGTYQTVYIATANGSRNPVGNPNVAGGACSSAPAPLPLQTTPSYTACTSNAIVNAGDTTILYTTFLVDSTRRANSKYTIRSTCPSGMADPTVYCTDNLSQNNGYIGTDRFPSMKKFQDNLRPAGFNDQNGGKVQVLLRLAEVYLIAAEADLGLGNRGEAATFLNVLRVRAANPALTAAEKLLPAYTNFVSVDPNSITLDFIMDERERELAGEFNRWYDLARPGATFFVARVSKYNPHAKGVVAAKHIVRPIPQQQIDGIVEGPAYPQNQGY